VQRRDGPPPFRELSNRRPIDALKLLLEAGANPDALGPDGASALHQAVVAGRADMIRVLADAGATLDVRNREGLTAVALAERMLGERRAGSDASQGYDNEGEAPDEKARLEVVSLLRELMTGRAELATSVGRAQERRGVS
jgi:hypothetical protein